MTFLCNDKGKQTGFPFRRQGHTGLLRGTHPPGQALAAQAGVLRGAAQALAFVECC